MRGLAGAAAVTALARAGAQSASAPMKTASSIRQSVDQTAAGVQETNDTCRKLMEHLDRLNREMGEFRFDR